MTKAGKLFEEGKILEAANPGYAKAQRILAGNYLYGIGGFAIDYDKGFDFAKKAANAGDKRGQLFLGHCYLKGWGVATNYATALTWYERCKDEHPLASNNMGFIYEKGRHGVVVNLTKAFECYRKAAERGKAVGQFNLGFMYYDGRGVNQSFVEARKFFKMSADQNFVNAQFKLRKMMMEGKGGAKNTLTGITLIEKAAEGGYANATAYLTRKKWMRLIGL